MDLKREMTNELILKYRPFVIRIADFILKRLPPHVDREEVIQWGMIGLVDALKKWDPNRENKFKTYAEFRIRGSILDGLRSIDWIPRSIRDKVKSLDELKRETEAKSGKSRINTGEPAIVPIAGDELADLLTVNPIEEVSRKMAKDILAREIEKLPKNVKLVLSLYYYEDLNLVEIGKVLKVTMSRVSQIKRQGIKILREKLRGRLNLEILQ